MLNLRQVFNAEILLTRDTVRLIATVKIGQVFIAAFRALMLTHFQSRSESLHGHSTGI